jgi:hypothetical protein
MRRSVASSLAKLDVRLAEAACGTIEIIRIGTGRAQLLRRDLGMNRMSSAKQEKVSMTTN